MPTWAGLEFRFTRSTLARSTDTSTRYAPLFAQSAQRGPGSRCLPGTGSPGSVHASHVVSAAATRALFSSTRAGLESCGSPLNAVVAAVLILAAVALLPLWRPVGPAGVPIGTLSHAPQGIATELRAMVERGDLPPPARVWNPQTWGSWFELAAPEVLVAVDSRIELFPGELWTDARQVENGTGEWLSILDKYAADAFIVAKTQNPEINAALDGSPKWHLAYSDADGSIWLRD